jgi:hypothetical protein
MCLFPDGMIIRPSGDGFWRHRESRSAGTAVQRSGRPDNRVGIFMPEARGLLFLGSGPSVLVPRLFRGQEPAGRAHGSRPGRPRDIPAWHRGTVSWLVASWRVGPVVSSDRHQALQVLI